MQILIKEVRVNILVSKISKPIMKDEKGHEISTINSPRRHKNPKYVCT